MSGVFAGLLVAKPTEFSEAEKLVLGMFRDGGLNVIVYWP